MPASTSTTSAAAAAARRRAKPKELSELDVYKKLIAGDIKGFLAGAWADVLMLLVGMPYAVVVFTNKADFLRPFIFPAHNLTINVTDAECHETEESACEYGYHDEDVYLVGPLDFFFWAFMVAGAFLFQDLVREFAFFVKKVVEPVEDRPKAIFYLRHSVAMCTMLIVVYSILDGEKLVTNLDGLWAGYPKAHQRMSLSIKTTMIILIAYYCQRAMSVQLLDIRWAKGQAAQLFAKSVVVFAVVLAAYLMHLSKAALYLLWIDGFKELVDSVTAGMVICAPVAMSEKKRAAQAKSELPTYPVIMGWLHNVQTVTTFVCPALATLLVANVVLLGLPQLPQTEAEAEEWHTYWYTSSPARIAVLAVVVVWQCVLPLVLPQARKEMPRKKAD